MSTRLQEPSVQEFPRIYPVQEQLRYLVRYAVLAPSTRNTQPWRFRVERDCIDVLADLSRLQPVADRDRRELYLSLGCAIENLLVAAGQFGFRHEVAYFPRWPDEAVVARIALRPGGRGSPERRGLTLQTLLARRSAHGRFTAEPVSEESTQALHACVAEPDLELSLVTDSERRRAVQGLHRVAHEIALADPDYREELADWVGQGAFGTPWPLAQLGRAAIAREKVAHRLARFDAVAVGSAPVLALISSRDDDRGAQLRSGQLLERLWLTATAQGLGLQPLSAALEIPRLRARLSSVMRARLPWAQQLVRLGHPRRPDGHRTPRRPLYQVLDAPGPGS
jgi:nitroreductase